MGPNFPSDHSATDPTEPVDELRKIAADIQDYMGKWVIRSRRLIGHGTESMQGEAGLSTQMQKFEENQRKWETRRHREMDELAEKAEELASAWLKLESEQRQFLQMKESWQHRTNPTRTVDTTDQPESNVVDAKVEPCAPATAKQELASNAPRMPQYTPQVAPRLPVNSAYATVRPTGGDKRDQAIRQFEQLRREVAAKNGS